MQFGRMREKISQRIQVELCQNHRLRWIDRDQPRHDQTRRHRLGILSRGRRRGISAGRIELLPLMGDMFKFSLARQTLGRLEIHQRNQIIHPPPRDI